MPSTVSPDGRTRAIPSWMRLVPALLAGAAVLAACSGGASTAPGSTAAPESGVPAASTPAETAAGSATEAPVGAATVDACTLITTDEVAAIVGKPVTIEPDEATEDWAAGECWWNSETMDVRFVVVVGTPASIAKSSSPTAQEQLDLFKIASMAPGAVDVSGLGDAAAYGNLILVTIKDGSLVEVFALPQDKATEIAKVVLTRMP